VITLIGTNTPVCRAAARSDHRGVGQPARRCHGRRFTVSVSVTLDGSTFSLAHHVPLRHGAVAVVITIICQGGTRVHATLSRALAKTVPTPPETGSPKVAKE
jgi:hypothetical protein